MLTTILTYILARFQERSTWLGITSALTGLGVALTPDQATTIVSIGLGAAGLIATLTKDTLPPTAGAILLALALGGSLSACGTVTEQQALQVACQVDAASQPIMVALAPLFGPDGAALAAADVSIAHPFVVATCAAIGGRPVAVTPAS